MEQVVDKHLNSQGDAHTCISIKAMKSMNEYNMRKFRLLDVLIA